jgi:hypothetical protein
LEVRRCGDGHPPVTKREREIRLNGICGVIFRNPDRNFGPGFCSLRIQSSIFGDPLSWFFQRTVIPNEMKDLNCITITPGKQDIFALIERPFALLRMTILVEPWILSVKRWAFLISCARS